MVEDSTGESNDEELLVVVVDDTPTSTNEELLVAVEDGTGKSSIHADEELLVVDHYYNATTGGG